MYSSVFSIDIQGVPLVDGNHLESIAESALGGYKKNILRFPAAIDIDDFAQNFLGIHQDIVPMAHQFIYAGASILCDTQYFPVYDPQKKLARYTIARKGSMMIDSRLLQDERQYRWAVAHQCGHLLLHQALHLGCEADLPTLNEPWFRCHPVAGLHCESGTRSAMVEQQASHLAMALLMPRQVVYILSENVPETGTFSRHDVVGRMVDTFQVPVEVAERRLYTLRT